MPTYEVETDFGKFRVESDRDLTDDEVLSELGSQMGANPDLRPPPITPPPEPTTTPSNTPDASFLDVGESRFFARTGRRIKEAAQAASDIPTSVKGVVTGKGPEGRGRVDSTLRLLEGAFSPVLATIAPIEAAFEEAGVGAGAREDVGKLIGDISTVPITVFLGMLGQAGKLSTMGQLVGEFLGAGRPRTIQEIARRDPQFRFAVTREAPPPASRLEAMARRPEVKLSELTTEVKQLKLVKRMEQDLIDSGVDITKLRRAPGEPVEEAIRNAWLVRHPGQVLPGMEELAMEVRSPAAAQALMERRKATSDRWLEFAKRNKITGDPPKDPEILLDQVTSVQVPTRGDIGIFSTIGTPATRAARNPQASRAMLELQATEKSINDAIVARGARVQEALGRVDDRTMNSVVRIRESVPHAEAMRDPKIPIQTKRTLQFIQDKFEVDRQIIIPRLRKTITPRVEKRIRKKLTDQANVWKEDLDEGLVAREVDKAIKKQIPDDWGLEQYLTHIFPGFYKIRDRRGNILGTASTKLEARFMIRDLAEELQMTANDFNLDSKAFFDSDLLRVFKGRVSRSAANIAKGTVMTKEEIADSIRGDFTTGAKIKFFGPILERKGKAKGYTRDLTTILDTYDRGIERWIQLSDLSERVAPTIAELGKRGYVNLARMIEGNLQNLWGFKHPVSDLFDGTIAATPMLREIVAPGALERMTGGLKIGAVNVFLRFNPRYHALNSTQLAATLSPIADGKEVSLGIKLFRSPEGKALLRRHQISERLGKVEGFAKGLGAPERMNQQVAFLTMYGKARRLGLNDQQAATYGLLRGNVYSQFLGLVTDKPTAFRKLDPTGMMFMFQRFPVKQTEMAIDLIKDRNFPGVAKFLTVNFLLGGMKAATLGTGGWLTYKAYQDIKAEYGVAVADMMHVGLPGLAGVDMSNSVMLVNPPFGETWQERVGNLAAGPILSTASSVVRSAFDTRGIEPSVSQRALNSLLQRIPVGKSIDGMRRLLTGDFTFRDPGGRLKWEGDFKDAIRVMLGARPINDANLDTFVGALRDMTERRNEVLNFAALRFGQAQLAGVQLPEDMLNTIREEVDAWNSLWPEFPVTFDDIITRATARQETAVTTLRERLLRQSPAALREGGLFRDLPRGGG